MPRQNDVFTCRVRRGECARLVGDSRDLLILSPMPVRSPNWRPNLPGNQLSRITTENARLQLPAPKKIRCAILVSSGGEMICAIGPTLLHPISPGSAHFPSGPRSSLEFSPTFSKERTFHHNFRKRKHKTPRAKKNLRPDSSNPKSDYPEKSAPARFLESAHSCSRALVRPPNCRAIIWGNVNL